MDPRGIQIGPVINGAVNLQQFGMFDPYKPIRISNEYELVPVLDTTTSFITLTHNGSYMLKPTADKDSVTSGEDADPAAAAKKKLIKMHKSGRKRKFKEELGLRTPEKSSSGPPTVQSSPLSPKRRKELHQIRKILFAKDLSKALEKVVTHSFSTCQSDTSIQLTDSADFSQSHQSTLVPLAHQVIPQPQDISVELDTPPVPIVDVPKESEPLDCIRDEVSIPDFMSGLTDDDYGNEKIFDGKIFDDFGLKSSIIGDEKCEQFDGRMVFNEMFIIGGDLTDKNESNQKVDVPKKEGCITFGVNETRNENCKNKKGKGSDHWFEKPPFVTKYRDILCCRHHFKFLIFLLARMMKTHKLRVSRAEALTKIGLLLGYGESKESSFYNVTRGMVDRFLNQKPGLGERQTNDLLNDAQELELYSNAATEIGSRILEM